MSTRVQHEASRGGRCEIAAEGCCSDADRNADTVRVRDAVGTEVYTATLTLSDQISER